MNITHRFIFIAVLCVCVQTTLYADNNQTRNTKPVESDSTIITPDVTSQYNLDGMQTREGQYKSSYSTNTLDKRDSATESSPGLYGNSAPIIPVVPVIILTDE